jgi:hypothetical protein
MMELHGTKHVEKLCEIKIIKINLVGFNCINIQLLRSKEHKNIKIPNTSRIRVGTRRTNEYRNQTHTFSYAHSLHSTQYE